MNPLGSQLPTNESTITDEPINSKPQSTLYDNTRRIEGLQQLTQMLFNFQDQATQIIEESKLTGTEKEKLLSTLRFRIGNATLPVDATIATIKKTFASVISKRDVSNNPALGMLKEDIEKMTKTVEILHKQKYLGDCVQHMIATARKIPLRIDGDQILDAVGYSYSAVEAALRKESQISPYQYEPSSPDEVKMEFFFEENADNPCDYNDQLNQIANAEFTAKKLTNALSSARKAIELIKMAFVAGNIGPEDTSKVNDQIKIIEKYISTNFKGE